MVVEAVVIVLVVVFCFLFISYVFESSVYFKQCYMSIDKKQLKNVLSRLHPRRTLSY